ERNDLATLIDSMLDTGMTTPPRLSDAAAALLLGHDWPGNLRELATVLHTARCLADDGLIDVEHLPDELGARVREPAAAAATRLSEHQDRLVADTLERLGGNVSAAARALGISRNRLYRQLARTR
ncbi:MAG: helix-turn-helix domain-containing protein, partial [Microvirgula sp.]